MEAIIEGEREVLGIMNGSRPNCRNVRDGTAELCSYVMLPTRPRTLSVLNREHATSKSVFDSVGQGAYRRDAIDGSDTKYSVLDDVRAGDIVVNNIDTRNGSVSEISNDLDSSFGSSEFPTYQTERSSLLPDWLNSYS